MGEDGGGGYKQILEDLVGNLGNPGNPGGGSSGPPVDQYVSDMFRQDAVAREKAGNFASIYMSLWGEPATEAYLTKAVTEGYNAFEFEAMERAKPEFQKTKTYKDEAVAFRDLLAQLGVG